MRPVYTSWVFPHAGWAGGGIRMRRGSFRRALVATSGVWDGFDCGAGTECSRSTAPDVAADLPQGLRRGFRRAMLHWDFSARVPTHEVPKEVLHLQRVQSALGTARSRRRGAGAAGVMAVVR